MKMFAILGATALAAGALAATPADAQRYGYGRHHYHGGGVRFGYRVGPRYGYRGGYGYRPYGYRPYGFHRYGGYYGRPYGYGFRHGRRFY